MPPGMTQETNKQKQLMRYALSGHYHFLKLHVSYLTFKIFMIIDQASPHMLTSVLIQLVAMYKLVVCLAEFTHLCVTRVC